MESEFAKIQLSEPLLAGSFIDGIALNFIDVARGKNWSVKNGGSLRIRTKSLESEPRKDHEIASWI